MALKRVPSFIIIPLGRYASHWDLYILNNRVY